MEIGKYKTREVQPTVLRLHPELRDELVRLAAFNGRSLTKEISARLQVSLAAKGPTLQGILAREAFGNTPATTPLNTQHEEAAPYQNDKSPAPALSDIDRAILAVVRAMPPEKQLALLSLFK